jgi:hypothetical protein
VSRSVRECAISHTRRRPTLHLPAAKLRQWPAGEVGLVRHRLRADVLAGAVTQQLASDRQQPPGQGYSRRLLTASNRDPLEPEGGRLFGVAGHQVGDLYPDRPQFLATGAPPRAVAARLTRPPRHPFLYRACGPAQAGGPNATARKESSHQALPHLCRSEGTLAPGVVDPKSWTTG